MRIEALNFQPMLCKYLYVYIYKCTAFLVLSMVLGVMYMSVKQLLYGNNCRRTYQAECVNLGGFSTKGRSISCIENENELCEFHPNASLHVRVKPL